MTGETGSAIGRDMTENPPFSPALLPAGFVDLLTPDARTQAQSVAVLMDVFTSHGYDPVRPPLMEFEDTYLAGAGAALAEQGFRVMDPDTRRMMVLRPDITPQVARMAGTRLSGVPRPLRVSYAGECVVVAPVAAEESGRQIMQAGIELIGPDSPEADAEVMSIGAEALSRLGVRGVSFDLTMPPFIPALLEEAGVPQAERPALLRALDRKDAASVAEHGGALAATLIALLDASGAAEHAVARLMEITLPERAEAIVRRLVATVGALRERCPGLSLTVDPVEFRGWKYHTGVCVTLFAQGRSEELGRGGRYRCNDNEPACGLTFRPDVLCRLIPAAPPRPRVYLATDCDHAQAAELRARGHATIGGFLSGTQAVEEARRLGCGFVLSGVDCVALT
ncbi:ATP phosphoribosyltransferase regulatory subunit [Acetobacter papayae]|uniref:ATP phosphoribosyltransferase regulatory subunit n=1 Tax=Acetobacter papayae TaxID=1076592 RepID=UPI000470D82F|nr:ATP phosphoribosyltransferase regulatory subunit [Acetobacter papayae]